jgi:serine/threonine-protein kinase RsbW
MTTRARQRMEESRSGQRAISLVIPCRAEYVGLCRVVAGVVGVRESLDEEDIADLKLVVTEACTCFLWGPDGSPSSEDEPTPIEPPRSLRVDLHVLPEAWEITISDPEHRYHMPGSGRCDPRGGSGLGLTIIKALVDSVEHTETEVEGSVIHLVKRLAPRSPSAGS